MKSDQFADTVLSWFKQHGRHDLPWQKNPTPYRVWLSEIMLQQTQVTTVIPYFQKFIRHLPSLKSLANAAQDDVLGLWTGLGYYSRARHLHATAKMIRQTHNGRFPTTVEALSQFPGIGRSTAGAIASLAMGLPAPILDGNVKRVLTRYHQVEGWPGHHEVLKQLWEIAAEKTPSAQTGAYNQAMMDLGATICRRRHPQCEQCPLQHSCGAHHHQRQHEFPTPRLKKDTRRQEETFMLIIQNPQQQVLLERRKESGIWGGLWCFPQCEHEKDIKAYCRAQYQCNPLTITIGSSFMHTFSHFDLRINPLLIAVKATLKPLMDSKQRIWYNLSAELPGGVASPILKLLQSLKER